MSSRLAGGGGSGGKKKKEEIKKRKKKEGERENREGRWAIVSSGLSWSAMVDGLTERERGKGTEREGERDR